MGTQTATQDTEFNSLQFEKTLTSLKDSQDSINSCCQWCLQNRTHHKKIVTSWLNVLKRVKVEQRLVLFYLANDVVQYSKRRNYEYVGSWGTALQKATTLVRDERVKHKILRIFKIWEQRGVYGEEFITDLCGLISVQPTGPKSDEPHEFQASYVINKIKNCANLERDTDAKLKVLKEHNPKIQISEGLITSLKDRVHVDDVEKEVDVYVKHMEGYINALKLEIKNRIALISVLRQAETQLESDRKDVKLVAHAYKTFGQRVKAFQKKLEEHTEAMPSPIPSPDINAPSPSPDSDLDLPEDAPSTTISAPPENSTNNFTATDTIQYTNAGYYNPVPPPTTSVVTTTEGNDSSFLSTNGFSSFLGSNLSFDLQNLNTSSLFLTSTIDNTQTTNSYSTTPTPVAQPPLPVEAPSMVIANNTNPYVPLLPPPMPPFSKSSDSGYANTSFGSGTDVITTNFATTIQPSMPSYSEAAYTTETGMGIVGTNTTQYDYQSQTSTNTFASGDEYDPSDVPTMWENIDPSWNSINELDTPESPPMFEKEGSYGDPVEYHDSSLQTGVADVDQRVLPGMGDLEDSLGSIGGKDVDHRNLISLTGSPSESGSNPKTSLLTTENSTLKTLTPTENIWDNADHDYRSFPPLPQNSSASQPPLPTTESSGDQDYRLQFNLDNITLPPPPPPPPKSPEKGANPPLPPPLPLGDPRTGPRQGKSPRKPDEVDNTDMDLSDEDMENRMKAAGLLEVDDGHFSMEPPPPLPELLDDVDANQFLDEISNDLAEFGNLASDVNQQKESMSNPNMWQPPPGLPPMNFHGPPPPGHMNMTRMEMVNAPPGLLATPFMDGPMHPLPPVPIQGNWMGDRQPPWMPPSHPMPFEEENPYFLIEQEEEQLWAQDNFNFRDQGRGAHNNFRGGFNGNGTFGNKDGFNGSFGNRGRGRGRGGGNRGRGGNSRGRGGQFRQKGFKRGRGR